MNGSNPIFVPSEKAVYRVTQPQLNANFSLKHDGIHLKDPFGIIA